MFYLEPGPDFFWGADDENCANRLIVAYCSLLRLMVPQLFWYGWPVEVVVGFVVAYGPAIILVWLPPVEVAVGFEGQLHRLSCKGVRRFSQHYDMLFIFYHILIICEVELVLRYIGVTVRITRKLTKLLQ